MSSSPESSDKKVIWASRPFVSRSNLPEEELAPDKLCWSLHVKYVRANVVGRRRSQMEDPRLGWLCPQESIIHRRVGKAKRDDLVVGN